MPWFQPLWPLSNLDTLQCHGHIAWRPYPGPPPNISQTPTGPRGPKWSQPLGDVAFVSVHQLAGAVPGFGQTASTRPCKDLAPCWMFHAVSQLDRFQLDQKWRWQMHLQSTAHQHKHSDGLRCGPFACKSMQRVRAMAEFTDVYRRVWRCTNWYVDVFWAQHRIFFRWASHFPIHSAAFLCPLVLKRLCFSTWGNKQKKKVMNYYVEALVSICLGYLLPLDFQDSGLWWDNAVLCRVSPCFTMHQKAAAPFKAQQDQAAASHGKHTQAQQVSCTVRPTRWM